jgi:hypothetical protein
MLALICTVFGLGLILVTSNGKAIGIGQCFLLAGLLGLLN